MGPGWNTICTKKATNAESSFKIWIRIPKFPRLFGCRTKTVWVIYQAHPPLPSPTRKYRFLYLSYIRPPPAFERRQMQKTLLTFLLIFSSPWLRESSCCCFCWLAPTALLRLFSSSSTWGEKLSFWESFCVIVFIDREFNLLHLNPGESLLPAEAAHPGHGAAWK